MDRREANTLINIIKEHTLLMFNKGSLNILDSFVIALILLVFVVYINNILCHCTFDLLVCSIFFLILLPPLLLCALSSPSMDIQTLFPSLSPSSFTFYCNQSLIYLPSPPTYPPFPIFPPPVDCSKSSYLMYILYLLSKTTSSPSSPFPSLTSSLINYVSSPYSASSSNISNCLSMNSCTHGILETDMDLYEMCWLK